MKRKLMMSLITLLLAGIFAAVPVFAEDEVNAADKDVIGMVGETETIGAVDNRITLPERASETARERSREGRETAEQAREAREERKEFGMERSREAREGELGEKARQRMMDPENMQDKRQDSSRRPGMDR